MMRGWHSLAIIISVGVIVLFTNLGGPRLWDRDEPRNAGCTAEMLARGDLITPVFDDELRTHKPILLYWFMMSAYWLFGVGEFSARFWSALMGVGTACLTYGIGRRLLSERVGLWAAVILVTTLLFDVAARAATPDSLLIFWMTAALYVYVRGTFPLGAGDEWFAGQQRLFPRWPVAIAMYAMMGMAVLTKGPLGLVLPTAIIGLFLLVQQLPQHERTTERGAAQLVAVAKLLLRLSEPRHFLRTCWLMRPITALLVVAMIALPWYMAVWLRTDGEWVKGFLLDHNVGRAAQSLEGHHGSLLFYPLALLVGFFPWSVFAAPTILESVRRIREGGRRKDGFVLAVCWIGVTIGLFSVARTKLPSYITPCYPAVALLVASFIVAWIDGRTLSAAFWPRAAIACLALIGMCMAAVIPWAASRYVPGEEWLALLGCIPMLTAIGAFGFLRAHAPRRAAITFGVGAVMLTTTLFALGAARVDRHQTFDQFVAHAFERSADPQIGTVGVLEPSWVFYARRPMEHLFLPELTAEADQDTPMLGTPRTEDWQFKPIRNAWHFLESGSDRFIITTASHLAQIGSLPADVEVIARSPYFLRDDELVLIARRTSFVAETAEHAGERTLR